MNFEDNRAFNKVSDGAKPLHSLRDELEALQNEFLRKLETNFKTWIRPVIQEELHLAFSTMVPQIWRVASKQPVSESLAREFHLQFATNPPPKIFTRDNILDKHGDTLHVKLIDAKTRQPVSTGPESGAKLEVVPLVGDFNHSEEQEWTVEEFEKHVAKERDNKGQLLVGDREIQLKGGVGTLGLMFFADNSSFVRTKKFRLGVRVSAGNDCDPLNIREGKSQAFSVRDRRGKSYEKHYTPAPTDEVWRLQNIRKDGPYHTMLEQKGIHTVEEFLSCCKTRPEFLRDMLGKMPKDAYEATVDHAKKCGITVQCDTRSVYRPVEQPANPLYDCISPVVGVGAEGHYHLEGLEMLDDTQQAHATYARVAKHIWGTTVTALSVNKFATTEQGPSTSTVFGGGEAAPANGWPTDHAMVEVGSEFFDANQDFLVWAEDAQRGSIGISNPSCNGEPSNEIARSPSIGPDVWEMVRSGQHVAEPQLPIDSRNQGPAGGVSFANPAQEGMGRWWLRIRTVVRCALFIRLAAHPAGQQPSPRQRPKEGPARPRHRMHALGCASQMSTRIRKRKN